MKNWLAISALSVGLAIALLTTNTGRHQPATSSVAEAAASSVTVTGQQCLTASDVRVAFNWNGLNEGAQWADLSLTNNGFMPGTFVGLGPIASGQTSFAWDGILGGFTHYLRINTLTAYGWSISPTIAFTTRNDCAFAISQTPRGVPATNLAVSQVCMPNGATRVVASWTSSNQGQQWLDDSAYNADFAPNSYVSVGPMAPDRTPSTGTAWSPAHGTSRVSAQAHRPAGWVACRHDVRPHGLSGLGPAGAGPDSDRPAGCYGNHCAAGRYA